jgi:hypothetical protein
VGDSHLSSVLVAFVSGTNKSKTEIAAPSVPGRVQPLALFGSAILLEGEDAAAYDQLFARICAAVKPVDIIEEMFVADLVSLEWEVLRWRRLKWSLIQARGREVLQNFLEPLRKNWIQGEPFPPSLLDMIREDQATKQLVQAYARREPDAVTLVHRLLTDAGASMDGLMAEALAKKLDDIERIDRLTSIAESRRNASLHEIERRRALLGETLRRSVQEIEDGEFEVIEPTPAEGKNVA